MELIDGWNDRPKIFADRQIAHTLGLNQAVVLQHIMWSISRKTEADRDTYFFEDRWWMSSSIEDFHHWTSLKRDTILRTIRKLENLNLIVRRRRSTASGNIPNCYSVNLDVLSEMAKPQVAKCNIAKANIAKPVVAKSQIATVRSSKLQPRVVAKCDTLTKSHNKESTKSLLRGVKPSVRKKFTDEDLELGVRWYEHSTKGLKNPPKEWSPEYFAEHVAKAKKKFDIDHQKISEVFVWIKDSSFWTKNCRSPASLTKRNREGIMKFDTISGQMKPKVLEDLGKIAEWTDKPIDHPFFRR